MPAEPRATYRLQLHAGFGFAAAARVVPYLDRLGISHLYSSPVLQAAPGSMHGYDVVDHWRVSSELGGDDGLAGLTIARRAHDIGHLLDIVPNHMAVASPHNRWWWDVLENGQSSRYAAYFDVDWDPPGVKPRDTVLLPVLEDQYGRVLEAGLLQVRREGGSFSIHYHDHQWPVSPRSVDSLLSAGAERCGSDELAFLATAFGGLALSAAEDVTTLRRRHREKEVLRGLLARLCGEREEVAAAVDAEVARINADPDLLDGLLERQNYRVAFWRLAARELGYRRFFDVNSLVGVRVEVERVFFDTHALVLGWLDDGSVDGLRIDHPDGLRNPTAYLHRLRTVRPAAWVVVEKVLATGERLRDDWPVAGTTGYEFMNRVTQLLVDPAGEQPLTDLYAELTGEPVEYAEVLWAKKHQVLRDVLGSDVNRLTALLLDVCEHHRRHRDYTRHELHEAVREVLACFPVYRTYVQPDAEGVGPQDEQYATEAVAKAKDRRPEIDGRLFDFLLDLLLRRVTGPRETELVLQFQQVTGPAMAKGAEDTAFYTFNRLVSLNEVGGDPARLGISIREFHEAAAEAQWRWPKGLLATSTHDSKRSEDVRARINVLSEIPGRWSEVVRGWFERHRPLWAEVEPDRNLQYLLYQTLVGAWPIECERLQSYARKAAREGKARTSWTHPNEAYERALLSFVEGVLADERFRLELEALVREVLGPGRIGSLAQVLLKLTAPGVPDIYQGTELWDLSLVDPDNRRPVDFERRRQLLEEASGLDAEAVWTRADEGLPKLWLIWKALGVRRGFPKAFGAQGEYLPLEVTGTHCDHVVAFARGGRVVTVVPRLAARIGGCWQDTAVILPDGEWSDVLGGGVRRGGPAPAGELFRRFPVALLAQATTRGEADFTSA